MLELFQPYTVVLIKILILLGLISLAVAYLTYMERKVIAHMQVRYGPMRVGWHGLLQPIADGLKIPYGDLRKVAEQGGLTTVKVMEALKSQSQAIGKEFSHCLGTQWLNQKTWRFVDVKL